MAMSEARARQLLAGQMSMSRKVYEAIPIESPWGYRDISMEMDRRQLSVGMDFQKLQGCVRQLREAGLVKEVGDCKFVRVPVRPNSSEPAAERSEPPPANPVLKHTITIQEKPVPQEKTNPNVPVVIDKNKTPIDLLSPIADKMRAFGRLANEIADDVENVASELEERTTVSAEELQQLRQLKTLLRGLKE